MPVSVKWRAEAVTSAYAKCVLGPEQKAVQTNELGGRGGLWVQYDVSFPISIEVVLTRPRRNTGEQ